MYDADTAYDAYVSLKGIKELSEAFNVTSSPLRLGAGTESLFLYFLKAKLALSSLSRRDPSNLQQKNMCGLIFYELFRSKLPKLDSSIDLV